MVTFFTTAKPFKGHERIIQRNALQSWKLLHPDVEVILFGDEEGGADVCAELGIRHEPYVERHESGMKYLNYMFKIAEEIARNDFLCYSNCDIVLMSDFWEAFEKVIVWRKRFLLVGRRWDTDVIATIEFTRDDWASRLRQLALTSGLHQHPDFIDFFVFSKGIYDRVPPLVVGRSYWDHWLVWKALSSGAPVVDSSPFIVPIHQNHAFGYHPQGKIGTHTDALALRNRDLCGNGKHQCSILDANYVFSRHGGIHWAPFHRELSHFSAQLFLQKVVNLTFRPRKLLGLRKAKLEKLLGKPEQHTE